MKFILHVRERPADSSSGRISSSTSSSMYPDPSICTAIVPWVPPLMTLPQSESGNQNFMTVPEGGIAAEISVEGSDSSDERIDLDVTSDDDVSTGSGFVYDDHVLEEILSDRFGTQRAETQMEKNGLVGTSTEVAGQRWTVRGDIPEDDLPYEDFIELGLRSNTLDLDSLPKRFRSRNEVLSGQRASPRISPKQRSAKRDESRAINSIFRTLYPVNWRQSLKRLNTAITTEAVSTRRKSNDVSADEYWIFIGLLLLCAVQKCGVDGLFKSKQTEGIIKRVNASKYMNYTRFKFIKQYWVKQFELEVDDQYKERNKWWRVGYLVNGFNDNRRTTVAASRVKTLDESMSAFRPQTKKTGNLPNISFILRKPEPLGTELKTVATKGCNGPILYAEIQEGKEGMTHKPYFVANGATCSCVLRLGKGTKNNGQVPDALIRNLYYGDSWFAFLKTAVAVTEELDSEFLGPVKTAHKQFPKKFLENTMKEWPPGSHLVMETTVRNNSFYAIGYKYNMKKVLCFICTENAGHTMPGKPYEAKWLDDNGRMASRQIPRPHLLSKYFEHSY